MEHPVLSFAQRLAERMNASAEIQRFRLAETQVKESSVVSQLIETIKKKQKELVHAKHYNKSEYARMLEKELDQLHNELEQLPIVCEYQQSQVEVNNLLQMIQSILAEAVSDKIEIETGGVVSTGCGHGGPCGCSK